MEQLKIGKVACNSVEIATKCAFMEAAEAFNENFKQQLALSRRKYACTDEIYHDKVTRVLNCKLMRSAGF